MRVNSFIYNQKEQNYAKNEIFSQIWTNNQINIKSLTWNEQRKLTRKNDNGRFVNMKLSFTISFLFAFRPWLLSAGTTANATVLSLSLKLHQSAWNIGDRWNFNAIGLNRMGCWWSFTCLSCMIKLSVIDDAKILFYNKEYVWYNIWIYVKMGYISVSAFVCVVAVVLCTTLR